MKKCRKISCWLMMASALILSACDKPITESYPVRLGVADQPSSALAHIALAKGFFTDENLDIDVRHYPSGKRALLDGFDQQKIDYTTTSEVPFVNYAFEHSDIRAVASIYTADNVNRIVARRDHNIETMQDLKHHQIATQEKSAVHYFMHLVLENFDIAHEEVNITFDRAENLVDRLVAGEIDAFAMREPYVSMAREKLQDKATILAAPGIYVQSELLISRQAHLQNNPEVTQRLLRALIKAEEFALQERSEAIALTAKALNTPEAEIEKIWSSLNLEVSLHQTLLPQLERVAKWVQNEIEPDAQIPYFLNFLDSSALKKASPERVSLVK